MAKIWYEDVLDSIMRAFTYMEIIWLIAFQIHTHFILWHGKWLSIVRKRSWTSFFEHDHLIIKFFYLRFTTSFSFVLFSTRIQSRLIQTTETCVDLHVSVQHKFDYKLNECIFFLQFTMESPSFGNHFFSLIIHTITGILLIWHINAVKNGMHNM